MSSQPLGSKTELQDYSFKVPLRKQELAKIGPPEAVKFSQHYSAMGNVFMCVAVLIFCVARAECNLLSIWVVLVELSIKNHIQFDIVRRLLHI